MLYEAWHNKIKEWQDKYPICQDEYYDQKGFVNPYVFMKELSKYLKDDDIIIPDSGGTLIWFHQGFKPTEGQTIFSAYNLSPMGYSLPAGIGAQLACPDRRVICIMGDGACNMNIQELATVAYHKLPLKIFVIDNKEYGIINQTFDTWLDGRHTASSPDTGLAFPDLREIAKAYGIDTIDIGCHGEFIKIKRVIDHKKPMFCRVKIKPGQQMLPKLTFGKPLEDLYPYLPKEEIEENMLCN